MNSVVQVGGAENPAGTDALQRRKLELEISELERPLWQRPGMVTPIVAALVSIAVGHYTGWFDVQSKRLENQRHDLKKDVETFQLQKTSLEAQVLKARSDLNSAQTEINALKLRAAEYTQKYFELLKKNEGEVAALKSDIKDARAAGDGAAVNRLAVELEAAERSLDSSQLAALELIGRLRRATGIAETETVDWEEKIKAEIRRTEKVDDDGCFVSKSDGMTHCLNF